MEVKQKLKGGNLFGRTRLNLSLKGVQTALYINARAQMLDEVRQKQPVGRIFQQDVHALKSRLPQLQAVVDSVLEWPEVDCADEGLVNDGLLVEFGQQLWQLVPHKIHFMMRGYAQELHHSFPHMPAACTAHVLTVMWGSLLGRA